VGGIWSGLQAAKVAGRAFMFFADIELSGASIANPGAFNDPLGHQRRNLRQDARPYRGGCQAGVGQRLCDGAASVASKARTGAIVTAC